MYKSIWSWDKVSDVISGLGGKLGFPTGDKLRFIGFELDLKTGKLYDTFLSRVRDDIAPSVYFVLYRYAQSDEVPETGELIVFRQLYGGDLYFQNYKNNVLNRLNREFSENIDLLAEVSSILGAAKAQIPGYDLSLKIYVFPYIPIYIAIDIGDEEFPPLINLYYDSSIKNYYTAEEAAHLSEILAMRLVELSTEIK
jgi:hypothetical protein